MINVSSMVKFFDDYHEIDAYYHNLGKGWRGKEIAFGPSTTSGYCLYWGLFWKAGFKPNKKQVMKMLIDAGFESKPHKVHERTGEPLTSEVY